MGASARLRTQVQEKLLERRITATPQRVEIGMLLFAKPCHLSADQIITALCERGSNVSKATVYNTLHLFSQQGIVREVALDPTRLVYDSTTSLHHHFYNVDTGELTDIDSSDLAISGLPDLPRGTVTESVELIIRVRSKA